MKKSIRYLGLDVHAETIACAIAEPNGEVLDLGIIPNRVDAIRKLVKRLGRRRKVQACYEAGPTGFVLYWQLSKLDVPCMVVAPTLIPRKPGDRVKTDRRDARMLARLHRAGELSAAWVPDAQHEALRDLVRLREAAVTDRLRARNRLTKLLLRHGLYRPHGVNRWTRKYYVWMSSLRFEHTGAELAFVDLLAEVEHMTARVLRLDKAIDQVIEESPESIRKVVAALQSLRGIGKVASATLVAEIGALSRFERPSQLMGYSGLVPRQHSSGARIRHGGITKTGNAHIRRVLVEAAWVIGRRPGKRPPLRGSRSDVSPRVLEISLAAQHRLHRRYWHLHERGKDSRKIAVAIARELLGFVWAVGVQVEKEIDAA